jgi:hypothetical protein
MMHFELCFRLLGVLAILSTAWITGVAGALHHLISANRMSPNKLHLIEFDDESETLKLLKTAPAENNHVWISLSVRKHHG